MIEQLPSLQLLFRQLQRIPYLASKNIYRVATHFLTMNTEHVEQFCKVLRDVKQNLVLCPVCFCWQEKNQACIFCSSGKRNKQVICVVETWQELCAIEKTRGYDGVYHVLGGVICPLEGIGPEDLTIEPLVKRIDNGVQEIIFATNQTPEGEATAAFIANKLKSKEVKISCLARGLPVGSSLDTMDRITIYKALSERRTF